MSDAAWALAVAGYGVLVFAQAIWGQPLVDRVVRWWVNRGC